MNRQPDPRQVEVPDKIMSEVLRRKSPQERLRIGFEMWISAYNMLMTHIQDSHPGWSPEAVRLEVARRMSHGAVDGKTGRGFARIHADGGPRKSA